MKLTKEKESELLQAYNTFWDANLSADMETFGSYLMDDFSIFGSANGEVFLSKQEAVKFYTATADQMRGKAQLRNRNISVQELDNNSVIIREESDLYVLIGEQWTFYGHARISCILKLTEDGWKAVHQHASFPDHRTEEGQQLAAEKIEKENLELREAVKRRTVELEHKTRELEIESSLERVRAVAMGMRKPDDMLDVCKTIAKQLELLKVKEVRNVQTAIIYESKGTYLNYEYYVKHDKLLTTEVNYNLHPEHATFVNKMLESPKAFYTQGFTGKELKDWYAYQKTTPQFADSYLEHAESLNYYMYSIGGVVLGMSTYSPLNEEEVGLFKRFRNVFDLAYKRFEDIEKAEAQVREARIEAALEGTRTQSMLMQHSNELDEISKVFHEQLLSLGIDSEFSFVWLPDEEKDEHLFWATWQTEKEGKAEVQSKSIAYPMDLTEPTTLACMDDWKSGVSVHEHFIPPLEIQNFFVTWEELLAGAEKLKPEYFPDGIYYTEAFMKYGCFGIDIRRALSEKEKSILNRFAIEFERAYTRFLDLQNAEAQAREAQIEVAVERVRAQSMAMHHPDDLDKINKEILTQLNWLQVQGLSGVTFYLVNEGGWVKAWDFSSPGKAGDPNRYIIQYDYNKYEMMGGPIKTLMQSDQSYLVADFPLEKLRRAANELEEINPAVAAVFKEALANGILTHQWSVCVKISNGILGIDTVSPPDEDIKTIVLKMAGAFNQAYTRFLDLQKAEAQVREAKIEAALEKVRSRSLAMHKSDEIGDVVWIVIDKMKELEIELDGISLVTYLPDSNDVLHWYANAKHVGQADTMFLPHFDNLIMNDCLKAKEQGVELLTKVYTREEKNNYFNYAVKNSDFKNLSEELKHWVREQPFLSFSYAIQSHSGIFLESYTDKFFSEKENDILVRFSRVFEQAYIRFMDLQKAEAQALRAGQDLIEIKSARKKAEDALTELQLTQKQLIQSEKMASLGELTAGIAHEIQNPLNFVNNFSDVSTELVTEMNLEIEKGNVEEAKQLAQDLKQNLEKINHHGKRAGDIVKGMLQHSRTSSGQKELTDINMLADEYLRLAYHGLKAKDKSFNAKFETNLDANLPKVNVVPQDIGRVILNLINNAFYAVSERFRQAQSDSYEPTVIVSTKFNLDKIEIRVNDNGNGIPEKIKDKIFQPFFTTKPTGQGTGLGLSLSYDIIKAHGGLLQVESEAGAGTQFKIQLTLESK